MQTSQGKAQEAVRRISAAAAGQPGNAKLQLLLSVAYLKTGDLERASASVKQAIAIDPKTPDAYGVQAEINRARGSLDQAVAGYQAAIAQNPNKVENYMALADLYGKQGRWDEAKRSTEHARSLDPASPFIANNLAFLYLEHGGDLNQALALAQQAQQRLPDSPVVADTIGWAYYKLHSPAAAVAQFTESLKRDPRNPVYHYHLGLAYLDAGNPEGAARAMQQALAANPDFPNAERARAALLKLRRPPSE